MTIYEKLEYLTKTSNKAAISRLSGLFAGWLSQTLKHEHAIRTEIAVRVAAVLKVDPSWLIDDSQGLPPVHLYKHMQAAEQTTTGGAA
jgi:hypothetical protein